MTMDTSKTSPRESGSQVRQFQFGMGCHDGTQYNFFAEDKVFSVRVIESKDLHHHSVWLFDGGVQEIVVSDQPMDSIGDTHLNLEASQFSVTSDDEQGEISARSRDGERLFEVDFKTPFTYDWGTPRGASVIHQPLIRATINYQDQSYDAIGYCKRYWFYDDTDYLAWRFVEGTVDAGRYMVWSADGNFGGDYQKYDYFKMAYANGRFSQAGDKNSFHRDDVVYADVEGEDYEVQIEGLGTWTTVVKGEETRLMLRQRFCKMKVVHGDQVDEGYAINETGVGAIR